MICDIPPPESLKFPLHVHPKLLMGPGPSNCPPRILSASSQQMLYLFGEDFIKIMEDVKDGIRYAFQTSNKMTFAITGSGHCAMETAIRNLLDPDDILLIASPGIWGDRAKIIADRLGAKSFKMTCRDNYIVDLNDLEKIVRKIKPKVIFICHGDSSTGVLQPLDGISAMVKEYDCLLLVDSVASLGAAPLLMDKMGIDVLYSGSQKILNAPPGLSPISFSPRAVELIKARKTPVTSFYMDCLLIGNCWGCDDNPIIYHHTEPMSLVYALREALSILAKETLEKSWERHRHHAKILYKQLEDMGLKFYVLEEEHRLPSVTTIEIPKHINGLKVIENMRKRFNIDISGGLGSTAGKVWRIGLMGYNCNIINVMDTTKALSICIQSSNFNSKL